MSNKIKKSVSVVGSMVLVFTLLAGCATSKSEPVVTNKPSTSTTSKPEATSSAPAKVKFIVSDFNQPVPGGKAMDIPFVKYLASKTNTDIDIEFLPAANAIETYRLKVASGEYGDVHLGYGLQDDLILANRALDLKPLIDQYGTNMKKVVPQAVWDNITVDGKIMGIPQPAIANSTRTLYIRKDWLDNLGLQIPKTSDELLNVLREFRDKDPNGNGKKDEIPFSMRDNWSWGDNIFGMFGVIQQVEMIVDGEVISGNMAPNMKTALEYFKTMYDEKLLDQDFLTNQRPQWEQKIKSDLVGVWNHAPELLPKWQDDLSTALPDKKPVVITFATPRGTGYEGPLGFAVASATKTYIVDKDAENPEAIVKMLDWLFSEEGQTFSELGIEGESYTNTDGKLTYDAEKDAATKLNVLRDNLFRMHGFNEKLTSVKLTPENAALLKNAIDVLANEGIPTLKKAPNADLTPLKNTLETAWQETAAKIVVGKVDIDKTFQEYVDRYRTEGAAIIKANDEWYEKNKK
ncbi:extracellular solute-binding protein [Paenibacillus sp. CMAA1364]